MVHLTQRLAERGIDISRGDIDNLARHCVTDTAIVLCQLNCLNRVSDGRLGSNGDLVILIVRHQWPITIMYRRSEQPLTPEALRVNRIEDRSV